MQAKAIQRRKVSNELNMGAVAADFGVRAMAAANKPNQPNTVASNMETISSMTGEVRSLATEVANAIAGAIPAEDQTPSAIRDMDLLYETSVHIGKLEALREELMRSARALGIR
jgi:hypothetical protein